MGHLPTGTRLPFVTEITLHETTALNVTVERAASGDKAAFARLVAQHQASMSRVAFVISGDADATRDAVQNAWSLAWRRLSGLRDPAQVGPWLIAIAANQAREGLRTHRRRQVLDVSESLAPRAGSNPADSIELLDLQRALAQLKPDDRHLIALRYVAGFDSTEIARQTGMSASGVRTRLSRILVRLRAEIDHA